MDTLTILKPVGGERMGKRFTRLTSGKIYVESYGRTYRYNASQVKVLSIEDLSNAIIRISKDPSAFVIRGEILDNSENIRRIKIKCKKTGDEPTVREVDRQWLCVDIDNVRIDPKKGLLRSAIDALPECFHFASCHYQLSSSAGVFDSEIAKVHLWYWLDRPVFGKSLREYFKEGGYPVDVMLYSGVQPHYTADPVFVNMPDPVDRRHGMIHGESEVVLPEEVLCRVDFERKEKEREDQRLRSIEAKLRVARMNPGFSGDFAGKCKRYASRSLEKAVARICGASAGNRHLNIYAEAASIAEMADHLDEHTAKSELINAGLLALQGEGRDQEVYRTVEDGWEEGIQNPRDLRFLMVDTRPPTQEKPKENKVDHSALFALKMGEDPEELSAALASQGLRIPSAGIEAVEEFSDLVRMSLNEYRESRTNEQSEVEVFKGK